MNKPENQPHVVEDLVEPVNRYINNTIAAAIVKFLKRTPITPNQVTYASIFIGLISAYRFSLGTGLSMVQGGLLLEGVLILDCVDGQLARAKGCSSDWGRLLDGIAGYIIYLAVLLGIMVGLKNHYVALSVIGAVTILKAISYDYCKLSMNTLIQKGYDGSQKEIYDTYQKIRENSSFTLKLYFYYLQVQQTLFGGRWFTLDRFGEKTAKTPVKYVLNREQREQYRNNARTLMAVWSWNGSDFPIFLLAGSAILGILEPCLVPLAFILTGQYIFTMLYHAQQKYKFSYRESGN
jgi:phosphatidylglycerophosphate synthase